MKIQINGKTSHSCGLKDLILLKWSHYPRQSTSTILIKVPVQFFFFAETEKKNPKIHIESQGTLNNQNKLEIEEQS